MRIIIIHYSLGVALSKAGKSKQAIVAYNNAIDQNPQYGYAYFNRGLLKGELGDHKGGVADFKMAESLGVIQASEVLKRLGE